MMSRQLRSSEKVRVFVSDIDGCLAEPYRPFRLDKLEELASLAGSSTSNDNTLPALTICSGRAYPYVEAMTQLLRLRVPAVFEAGGGMFDPVKSRWLWHPAFTSNTEREVADIRKWLQSDIAPGTAMDIDHAKKTQASLAGPIAEEVSAAVPRVEEHVAENHPDLLVAHTHISIDVIPRGLNKASGMRWLADVCRVPLEQFAFIGDTNGDIPALEIVGYAFAPANAADEVKEIVNITTGGAVVDGVLEAYRWCAARNEAPA